ncbi:MAG: ABC transporter ATP-binding protein [Sneathiellaceae bacterium]
MNEAAPIDRPAPGARFPEAAPAAAISARGLTKSYASHAGLPGMRRGGSSGSGKLALKGIDLEVPRGSFFGLLGPNGAGKSTFINILAGLVMKTAGEVSIWGHDLDSDNRNARAAIGIVPQELNIDPFFTPEEVLEFQAGLYGVPAGERRTAAILAAMALTDKAKAYARTLSGGMRRRLLVGKAMVHNPPVLVLDEPTAGVDVELRQQLWDHVRALNRQGVTIVLTTHYLEEAESLCDRIAIIHHGEVVACDTTPALLARLDWRELRLVLGADLNGVPAGLADLDTELRSPRELSIRFRRSSASVPALLDRVRATGLEVLDLSTEEADLEDLFVELTRSATPPPAAAG